MKKFLTLLAAIAFALIPLSAKDKGIAKAKPTKSSVKYGIVGGVNFTQVQAKALVLDKDYDVIKNTTSWNVGFMSQLPVNKFFTVSMAALYTCRQATLVGEETVSVKTGYVEIPACAQIGFDLLLFRPYIEAGIFGGYLVNASPRNDLVNFRNWEFGAKAGAGLEVWKFQISAHYNWNFIPILKSDKGIVNYVDLSLAFLF